MFTTPTVFVLGAGVSAPFGFPVGRQMKDAICNGGYTRSANHMTTMSPERLIHVIAESMGEGYTPDIPKQFLGAFRASDLYSVDAWLEANQSDSYLMKAGKAAIAVIIMNAESIAKNMAPDVATDWYAWLWNNLWTPSIEDIKENKVWFITFNYDRLLEWKLRAQIDNTYLRAKQDAKDQAFDFLKQRIIHVHGVLGGSKNFRSSSFGVHNLSALQNGTRDSIARSKITFTEAAGILAKDINIVCESHEDDKVVEDATDLIKAQIVEKGARIVFLGFSYDKRNVVKLNMDKHGSLGLSSASADGNTRVDESTVIGSAMGIKRAERFLVEARFGRSIALGGPDADAVEFCRSYLTPE